MNVLMVGSGGGSFEMRGRQIGAALGARVTSAPKDEDWRWADVAVLVKHAGIGFAKQAHAFDVPIVWDVLDCWQQPEQNVLSIDEGKQLIASLAQHIKPVAMIAATQRMADDIGGVYIPHHCRIGLKPKPVRDHVWTVAYDGQKKYLGCWFMALEDECMRRGWRFVVNPFDLVQADILVAFRDGKWDGPLCRAWKSGVKYVNAKRAGRPIITQACAAVDELLPMRCEVSEPSALSTAFDMVSDTFRIGCSLQQSDDFTVDAITASYYCPLLERVKAQVAA